eukprot:TRINITY_DN24191_c0_g1_i1.p2 TRINITY_DN24191_c0_g1~~TRINITY_DN24191_c0_g1_i1.p2  ORF type:complete len:140 (-),score=32.07 TRINITY_DN24191_c0_g1_i1:328-747(-)
MVFFFFNDTATTEIYTRSIVGSVRCVQETGINAEYMGEEMIEENNIEKMVNVEFTQDSFIDSSQGACESRNCEDEIFDELSESVEETPEFLSSCVYQDYPQVPLCPRCSSPMTFHYLNQTSYILMCSNTNTVSPFFYKQ